MKNKLLVLSIVLAFVFQYASAQTLDVEWGALVDLPKKTQYIKLAGHDADKYYVIRSSKEGSLNNRHIWLESISKTTNEIDASYEIAMPEVYSKKTVYENLFYIDGKLLLFVAVNDMVKTQKNLYAYTIQEDGNPVGEPVFVGSTPLMNDPESGFHYNLSPNGKKIIVQYHNVFSTYTGEPFHFKVFNSDLKLVEKQNFELPFLKRKFNVIKYQRGESGNYYFAVKLAPVKTRRSSSRGGGRAVRIKYEYKMLIYNAKKEAFQPYNVAVEKFTPQSITFKLDEEENVLLFGQATKRSAAEISAIYYKKLNPRLEKYVAQTYRDFSKDRSFLADFKNERNGTGPDQWYSYTPGKIVFTQDGSAVYLTEQYYRTERTMVEPKTKKETTIYYYTYGDILAVNANYDNHMEWYAKVPKSQFSTNDGGYYSSYYVTTDANKVKIFFNDHSRNFGKVPYGKIKTIKFNVSLPPSGEAAVITIYSDGNVDKAKMFPKDSRNVNIVPALFLDDEDHFFIYGQDRNDFKFGNFFFE